jgi:hypothetical protein
MKVISQNVQFTFFTSECLSLWMFNPPDLWNRFPHSLHSYFRIFVWALKIFPHIFMKIKVGWTKNLHHMILEGILIEEFLETFRTFNIFFTVVDTPSKIKSKCNIRNKAYMRINQNYMWLLRTLGVLKDFPHVEHRCGLKFKCTVEMCISSLGRKENLESQRVHSKIFSCSLCDFICSLPHL